MCCTRLPGNAGRKNNVTYRHLGTIGQFCRAVSSQLRHMSTIGKIFLSSNTSCTCRRNMVNFGPLTAEISSGVWGTPANFKGFRVLAALLHGTLIVGVKSQLRRHHVCCHFDLGGGHGRAHGGRVPRVPRGGYAPAEVT